MKKRNKNGFTLIELLAVIIILGILMIIAIPSVSEYIIQTRKKTLVTTIGNYMSSAIVDVNSLKYSFTEENTIYAIPIDCISTERGGDSPFGEWKPMTNNSWAYVLVKFDGNSSSYIYGFTFKDSSGYSLYPTTQEKMKDNGEQIKTNQNITKPFNGFVTNITEIENWNGFDVSSNTKLKILEHDSCDFFVPCTTNGTNIGDKVSCGTEEFYILESNSNTITMLARYNLDIVNNIQKEVPGSNGSSSFTTTNCIPSGVNNYPKYIYNENCTIYNHVENYEKYLINLGITSVESRLISHVDLEKLGCTIEKGSGSCTSSYDWLYSSYGIYWTGSATGTLYPYYGVHKTGIGSWNPSYPGFVRPVITISTDEIKIK